MAHLFLLAVSTGIVWSTTRVVIEMIAWAIDVWNDSV